MNRIRALPITLALCLYISACSQRVEMKSVNTPAEQRYSLELRQLVLRPGNAAIGVPFNELWALHTNPVSRGWPQNEPYVGKAWDRAEVRFVLLPEIRKRTTETELVFSEPLWEMGVRFQLLRGTIALQPSKFLS